MKEDSHRIKVALVLLFVILFALIVVTEILLRAVHFDFLNPVKTVYHGEDWRSYHMLDDDCFTPDPYLFWKPNPLKQTFNSKGFRGKEFSDLKEEGAVRIFCLRNSNTLGGVLSSYPGELQKILDKDGKGNFEVINAGVNGYTSFQGIRRFEQILDFAPDIITVCFGWNDGAMASGLGR